MSITTDSLEAVRAMIAPAKLHQTQVTRAGLPRWVPHVARDRRIAVAAAAQRRLLALGGNQRWGTLVRVGAEAAEGLFPDPQAPGSPDAWALRKLSRLALEGLISDQDAVELSNAEDPARGRSLCALPMVAVRTGRRRVAGHEYLLTGVSPTRERMAAAGHNRALYSRLHRRWLHADQVPDSLEVVEAEGWVQKPSVHTPDGVRAALTELLKDAAPAAALVDDRTYLKAGVMPGRRGPASYRQSWTENLDALGPGLCLARAPQQWGGDRWSVIEVLDGGGLGRSLDLAAPAVAAKLPGTATHERAWLVHLACGGRDGVPGAHYTLHPTGNDPAKHRLHLGIAAPAWLGRSLDLLGYRETPLPLSWMLHEDQVAEARALITPWYAA